MLRTIYIKKTIKTYSGRLWDSLMMIWGLFDFLNFLLIRNPNLQNRRRFSDQIPVSNYQSGRKRYDEIIFVMQNSRPVEKHWHIEPDK